MPFVIGNGTGIMKAIFKLGSDPEDMIVTLGYKASAAFLSQELIAIYDAWADNVVPLLTTEYAFRGIEVHGKEDGGSEYLQENLGNETGPTAAEALPQNCACLVRKRTGLAGRANRGRMYVPGVVLKNDTQPNGTIESGALGSLQTAFTQLFDDLNVGAATGIADLAVLHPAGTHTVVTALEVDDVIATQRRRLR